MGVLILTIQLLSNDKWGRMCKYFWVTAWHLLSSGMRWEKKWSTVGTVYYLLYSSLFGMLCICRTRMPYAQWLSLGQYKMKSMETLQQCTCIYENIGIIEYDVNDNTNSTCYEWKWEPVCKMSHKKLRIVLLAYVQYQLQGTVLARRRQIRVYEYDSMTYVNTHTNTNLGLLLCGSGIACRVSVVSRR